MSRKVSMRASITNKTSIFGIMGGLYNRKISGRSSMNRVTSRLVIPAGAKEGYQYMKMHNLLSRNPLGSGGVGKMFRLRAGGSRLGSIRTSSENSENNLGAPLKCQSQLGGDCIYTTPAVGCCTGTMACNWNTGTCYDPSPGDTAGPGEECASSADCVDGFLCLNDPSCSGSAPGGSGMPCCVKPSLSCDPPGTSCAMSASCCGKCTNEICT